MASANPPAPPLLKGDDPIDALLSAHGLRRTAAARRVLGWLLAHPDTSYTHAQLQESLADLVCRSHCPLLVRAALKRSLLLQLVRSGISCMFGRIAVCRANLFSVQRPPAIRASCLPSTHQFSAGESATCVEDLPCRQRSASKHLLMAFGIQSGRGILCATNQSRFRRLQDVRMLTDRGPSRLPIM